MPAEHDEVTVSPKEWWSHEWMAVRLAVANMGWWAFGRGAAVAALAYFAQHYVGLRTMTDTGKMVLTSLGAALVVCLGELAFRLLVAPTQLYKKAVSAHKDAEAKVTKLNEDKQKEPRIEMTCETDSASPNSDGFVVVALKNASEKTTIKRIELTIQSVRPQNDISGFLPSRVLVASNNPSERIFVSDNLHATRTAEFVILRTNEHGGFWFRVEHPHSGTIFGLENTAKFPNSQCALELVATAENTVPTTMWLKLSLDGKSIKAELSSTQ